MTAPLYQIRRDNGNPELVKPCPRCGTVTDMPFHACLSEPTQKELSELRADKARLDWLDERGRERRVPAACVRKGETMNGHSFDSTDWLAEPRVRAERESQRKPGGERAEFPKPTN